MTARCVWCGDDELTGDQCSTCGAAHSRDDAGRLVLVGWPGGCESLLESVRARLDVDDEVLTGTNPGGDARLMAAIEGDA